MKRFTTWKSRIVCAISLLSLTVLLGCTPPPEGGELPASYDNDSGDGDSGDGLSPPFNENVTYLLSAKAAEDRADAVAGPPRDGKVHPGHLPTIMPVNLMKETSVSADPLDWTFWRGPRFDGTSRETGLPDDWNPQGGEGSNVLWSRDDLGSRSTPIVMRGKLYLLARADTDNPATEGERVVCIDAATGENVWENRFNVSLSDVPDTRVAWSSVVGDPATGNVYALGVCGLFQCIDGETGKTLWSRTLHEEFGLLSTYGGRTNFPVIIDDQVIVSAVVIGWGENAKPGHWFISLDKSSGEVIWYNGTRPLPYDTTYSAPTIAMLGGQLSMVFGSGDGALWSFQPRTGVPIWQYKYSRRGLDLAPLVAGNRVFMGHREENITGTNMGGVVAVDEKGGELWKVEQINARRSAPLMIGDRLFVIDDTGRLHIFDSATGDELELNKRASKLGRNMFGSPLYADGKIYAFLENGQWVIIRPDEDAGFEIVSKGRIRAANFFASPICSHGRLYVTSSDGLFCLEDTSKSHGVKPSGEERLTEPAVADDPKPAHLQLAPTELILRPGQTKGFHARLYNSHGQQLGDAADVTFSLKGAGKIGSDGVLSVDEDADHGAIYITAQVGSLTATARVRVMPELPWKFDFENVPIDTATGKGQPPVTWVGMRYRHIVREIDGNKALVKVTTIPKGTRSRGWIGQPEMSNYTIQADFRGANTSDQTPDMAVIAQGYVLDMQGNAQKLQIRSWATQLRMAKTIDFAWAPDRWYTMKFRAAVEDGRGVLRGKVWPRDETEPEAWTIEAVDESPNLSGSPGFFGNATIAEILIDNVLVTSND